MVCLNGLCRSYYCSLYNWWLVICNYNPYLQLIQQQQQLWESGLNGQLQRSGKHTSVKLLWEINYMCAEVRYQWVNVYVCVRKEEKMPQNNKWMNKVGLSKSHKRDSRLKIITPKRCCLDMGCKGWGENGPKDTLEHRNWIKGNLLTKVSIQTNEKSLHIEENTRWQIPKKNNQTKIGEEMGYTKTEQTLTRTGRT